MKISISFAAITGDCSAGFITTVLPVASAAVVMPVRIASGKFHGAMTAATPRGRYSVRFSSPGTCTFRPAFHRDGRLGVVFAKVDRLADVGIGLAPRLAAFEHFPSGQLEPPAAQRLGGSEQILGPPASPERDPSRQRPLARRPRHRPHAAVRPPRKCPTTCEKSDGSIDFSEPFVLHRLAVDPQRIDLPQFGFDMAQRFAHPQPIIGHREIRQRLVAEIGLRGLRLEAVL